MFGVSVLGGNKLKYIFGMVCTVIEYGKLLQQHYWFSQIMSPFLKGKKGFVKNVLSGLHLLVNSQCNKLI